MTIRHTGQQPRGKGRTFLMVCVCLSVLIALLAGFTLTALVSYENGALAKSASTVAQMDHLVHLKQLSNEH